MAADNKLMLKINFQQQYKTIAFDPDSTVAQAIVFIRQKLALSEGPQVAQLGLFLGTEGDEKPAGGVGPGNIPGMFLADDISLRLSGVHSKVALLVVCIRIRVCGEARAFTFVISFGWFVAVIASVVCRVKV